VQATQSARCGWRGPERPWEPPPTRRSPKTGAKLGTDGSGSGDLMLPPSQQAVDSGNGGGGNGGGNGGGGEAGEERLATFHELERRLEEELERAREREAALQAELRQRNEQLSELVVCPITHEPMVDPVSAADGQTYERRAIEEWLAKGKVPISPLTGEPLKDTTLRPNYLAREVGYAAVTG